MADDDKDRLQKSRKININEEHEVGYWAEGLGVTRAQIRLAVDLVGDSVDAVERELKRAA